MQFCDTVFFLDYPTEICIAGIKSRKGKERTDIPCATLEDEDQEFVEFIKNYNFVSRPMVMELLHKYSHKRIIIFENRNYPEKRKDLYGDMGVTIDEFEIWRSIAHLDYGFFRKEAVDERDILLKTKLLRNNGKKG